MKYNLDNLGSNSFELLVRSLAECEFGISCKQYGEGPDGQREFVFDATIENNFGKLSGRTIGQAKFKSCMTKDNDLNWLKKVIKEEIDGFREKKKEEPEYIPNNYLFFTNVVLTPVKNTGVQDKIEQFIKETNDVIENFIVLGYDNICALLDIHRDVATGYASYIMPGDILMALYHEFSQKKERIMELLLRYLEKEFLGRDLNIRLEQAGSVGDDKIKVESTFIDLFVTDNNGNDYRFVENIVKRANSIQGYRLGEEQIKSMSNVVLIGGAGQGKTTLCQFVIQLYRAVFLKYNKTLNSDVSDFLNVFNNGYKYQISCYRIPIKIILKEYASWIAEQKEKDRDYTVKSYIKHMILLREAEGFDVSDLLLLLKDFSWIFIFDGLDEVPVTSNRSEMMKEIRDFVFVDLKNAKCDCILIATTRPQGYSEEFGKQYFEHVVLKELNRQTCMEYLNKFIPIMEQDELKQKEFLETLGEAIEDDLISRLLVTPLQATIIAILVKSGGRPPKDRYTLFESYYEIIVKREKQKKVIPQIEDNINWIDEVHYKLAYKLQLESQYRENASAEIERKNLVEMLEEYLKEDREKDEFLSDNSKDNEKEVKELAVELLNIVSLRLCLLVEDKEDMYSFPIRSIQEYLASRYICSMQPQKLHDEIKRIAYSSYWRNVLLFCIGYINRHRKYMEDNIRALCSNMNGESLLDDKENSESICFYGSWLALDILNDGVFKPSEQNYYIKLLKELITLPCSDRIKNLCLCSEQIKKKFIVNILLKEPEVEKPNFWYIVFQMVNDGGVSIEDVNQLLIKFSLKKQEELIFIWIESCDVFTCCKKLNNMIEDKIIDFCVQEIDIPLLSCDNIIALLKEGANKILENKLSRKYLINSFISDYLTSDVMYDYTKRKKGNDLFYDIFKCNIEDLLKYLEENTLENKVNIKNTGISIDLSTFTIAKNHRELNLIYKFLKENEIETYSLLVLFLIEFNNHSYLSLLNQIEKEPKQLQHVILKLVRDILSKYLHIGFCEDICISQLRNIDINSEWHSCNEKKRYIIKMIHEEKFTKLMKNNILSFARYLCLCRSGVLSNFTESINISIEQLRNMDDEFIRLLILIAYVDCREGNVSQATLNWVVEILKEVNRREKLKQNVFLIMLLTTVILEGKGSEGISNLVPLDNKVLLSYSDIDYNIEETKKIIDKILQYTIFLEAENDNLKLVPLLITNDGIYEFKVDSQKMEMLQKVKCIDYYNRVGLFILLSLCKNVNITNLNGLLNDIIDYSIQEENMFAFSEIVKVYKYEARCLKIKEQVIIKLFHSLNEAKLENVNKADKQELLNSYIKLLTSNREGMLPEQVKLESFDRLQ